MTLAYWLIGREILLDIQSGENRAEYGKKVLEVLSKKLTAKYEKGFSVSNLRNFRKFYQCYSDRFTIQYPAGTESTDKSNLLISYPVGTKSDDSARSGF